MEKKKCESISRAHTSLGIVSTKAEKPCTWHQVAYLEGHFLSSAKKNRPTLKAAMVWPKKLKGEPQNSGATSLKNSRNKETNILT